MVSEHEKLFTYVLAIPTGKIDENGIPVFSFGKLLHVTQNICSKYSSNFSIKEGSEYIYDSGDVHREDYVLVTLTGTPEDEVNSIAADLSAFLSLPEIRIRKSEYEYYSVSDSVFDNNP